MSGLADLLDPRAALLLDSADSAEDVIRRLSAPLLASGAALASLPDAAVARELAHPTGLELSPEGPNAALPHADREHVARSAIAIATLRTPVEFHRMDRPEQPVAVRLVILLALADDEGQLAALREVGALLQRPESVAALLDAHDAEAIVAALRSEGPR